MIHILQRFSFLAVSNAYVSVDTFFVLSGLLVSYLTLKKISRSRLGWKGIIMYISKLNILLVLVHGFPDLTAESSSARRNVSISLTWDPFSCVKLSSIFSLPLKLERGIFSSFLNHLFPDKICTFPPPPGIK